MQWFRSIPALPWPVQSLLVCAVFLVMGVAVVGDYTVGVDTRGQQIIAERNLAFITGDADQLGAFVSGQDRYYGAAFELPLLLIERGVEWKDSRSIYLMRHLVTHGFFLIGGLCCSLLMYRLSNRRGLALVVLLLFVMQPRLYAHSFFNSKDLPFLSMFMVTLYLTHRAFRKETVGAFLLCGVSVGILTNLRIMGGMVLPAVLTMRGLDWLCGRPAQRKQVVATGAVFAGGSLATLYGLSPYLWADPFELLTAIRTLAHHPVVVRELFQGELIGTDRLPPHFIPTWLAISTPSVTLGLGVLGATLVGGRSVLRVREALLNTDLRFGLLLLAYLTLPVVAVGVLGFHLQDTWRHMFFLHAPLCCLAGVGLQWVRGRRRPAAVAYALVGLGVLVTGWEVVRLHPHQQVYFNAMVARTAPEYLRTHYTMDPWGMSCREGLDFLRRRYPDTTVYVPIRRTRWGMLPPADRGWIVPVRGVPGDVKIRCGKMLQKQTKLSLENALYVRKVYNSVLLTVQARVTVPDRQRSMAHRVENTYREVVSGRLVGTGPFDVYTYPGSRLLGYARRGCTGADVEPAFFVHVVAEDEQVLPAARRQYGFDSRDFLFSQRGKRGGGGGGWGVGGKILIWRFPP